MLLSRGWLRWLQTSPGKIYPISGNDVMNTTSRARAGALLCLLLAEASCNPPDPQLGSYVKLKKTGGPLADNVILIEVSTSGGRSLQLFSDSPFSDGAKTASGGVSGGAAGSAGAAGATTRGESCISLGSGPEQRVIFLKLDGESPVLLAATLFDAPDCVTPNTPALVPFSLVATLPTRTAYLYLNADGSEATAGASGVAGQAGAAGAGGASDAAGQGGAAGGAGAAGSMSMSEPAAGGSSGASAGAN